MKRTDLIALTDLLAVGTITDSESQRLADFLRQIAQAQPVAARHDWRPAGRRYIDSGSGSGWLTRHNDAEPLYTLPLED